MILSVAALLLVAVIAYQNWKTPQLRTLTISDGLYQDAPNYWMLDIAYVGMAFAMSYHFQNILAYAASAAFVVTGIADTLSKWVDTVTGGLHSKIHDFGTAAVFLLALTLEAVSNHTLGMWILSIASVALPALAYKLLPKYPGPFAEKIAVFLLCVWLFLA